MFASGLSKGFYERGEQRNRQRREIANAFNQFKQQNPEATLQDFQSFIDAQVGNGLGSNYLRGGAPSKEVLGSIADSNLRNKNRRIAQETRADIMAQGDLSGYLSGMMDKALLNANPQKLEDAKSTFLSGLSPEAQQAVTNSGTLNNWTESRYNFLQGQRMMTMLPQIDNYLKLNNYSLDSITPEKMSSAFGIQPYEAQQFVDAAKNRIGLQMTEWWQNNNARIQSVAEKAAQKQGATRASIEEAVQLYLKNSNLEDNFLTEYKPMLDGLVTEAEELTKQRELSLENEAAGRMAQFEADVEANADLARLISNGDQKGALEKLMTIAKRRLNDTDFQKMFGVSEINVKASAFQDVLDGRVGFLTDAQAQQYQKNYGNVSDQARELTSGFVPKNAESLYNTLKTAMDDDQAGQLSQVLGGQFYNTASLARNIIEIRNKMPEDIRSQAEQDASVAINYIAAEVAKLPDTIPVNTALTAQKGMLEERSGLFAPQGFDEFIRSEEDQLTTAMADMDTNFREILSQNGDNPANMIAKMNQLMQALRQFESGIGREMQARERNRLDWVKPNTGGYNPAAVKSSILDPTKNKIEAMTKMIRDQIKQSQSVLDTEPVVTGPVVAGASTTESKFEVAVGDLTAKAERLSGLRSVTNDNTTMFPSFRLTEDEQRQQEIVTQFLGGQYENSAYFRYLSTAAPQAEYDAFVNDPLGFIMSSEQGQEFLQTYKNGEYAGMIQNP